MSRLPASGGSDGSILDGELDAVGEARLRQPHDVIQHLMDVHRLFAHRPLVAEHLHAVDQIADAVGLRADELCQRPVVVSEAGLQQLGGAPDPRKRVLDLMRQHGREARYRARRGPVRKLPLDHLRHRTLLQHQHDQAGMVGHGAGEDVDQFLHAAAWQADVDAVFVDGSAGAPDLSDQCRQRARECDDVGQRLPLQHALAQREERFRGGVGVEHTVVVAQDEDGMRQHREQKIVLDMAAGARIHALACGFSVHAASRTSA